MLKIKKAQDYLRSHDLAGWLLHDYQHSNPVFWEFLGLQGHTTRPCFFYVPQAGDATLLAHSVDAGRFSELEVAAVPYVGRADMQRKLGDILRVGQRVAMEYSPLSALPSVSHVDAGTLELVKSLGVEVVSSANLIQHTIALLDESQLETHRQAASRLGRIVLEAFEMIGRRVGRITEWDVREFIRRRMREEQLEAPEGPVVAVNENSGDPHYEPVKKSAERIRAGNWVLIDLWARLKVPGAIFGDLTWVAYVGKKVPDVNREVFGVVKEARDAAVRFIQEAAEKDVVLKGREVDQHARQIISERGYGQFFTHRLGHSLGRTVHAYAVNLDGFETSDFRNLVPGVAFTVEPGIYLPAFGVRSEINAFMTEGGPVITSPVQDEIVLI